MVLKHTLSDGYEAFFPLYGLFCCFLRVHRKREY
jgi:hypothetical protein